MTKPTPSASELLAHLLDERVIAVRPSLVALLGSGADAIVFQQINYWMPIAKNEHAGHLWVYKTYAEWAAETGLTASQVKCSVQRLERLGVVASCQPEGSQRRKWYRILDASDVSDGAIGRFCPSVPSAESARPSAESARPSAESAVPSSYTENTQESTQEIVRDAFADFYNAYPRKVARPRAEKAWTSRVVRARVATDDVAAGLHRWCTYWRLERTEVRHIPHPASWLNAEQWNDMPPPVSKAGAPVGMDAARAVLDDIASGRIQQ